MGRMENSGSDITRMIDLPPEGGDPLANTQPVQAAGAQEQEMGGAPANIEGAEPTPEDAVENVEARPAASAGPAEVSEISDIEQMATTQAVQVPAATDGQAEVQPGPAPAMAMSGVAASKSAASKKSTARKPAGRRKSSASKFTWLLLPLLGVGILVVIGGLSALGGYVSGITLRTGAEQTQVVAAADEQFQLGLQNIENKEYSLAQQRLEYVIKLNPNYPGAADKLAEVLLAINSTATPTAEAEATMTPTPDARGTDELFNQGQQAFLNSQWDQALETLLSLRKVDPAYHTVEVDGMLFEALRNRGADKILKQADLEGGIYDLSQAAKFGPLDSEAQGLLNWSTLYITGASFWDIDWAQAVNYFQQVAPQVPNLMDSSKMTANERLRQALYELGNQQLSKKEACDALQSFQQSLAIAPDAKVQQAADVAQRGCHGDNSGSTDSTETPKPGKKPKKTPGP
jgi:tetratricopeptide (TPR) repeat protein